MLKEFEKVSSLEIFDNRETQAAEREIFEGAYFDVLAKA
jgi:hypothetical protein